MTNVMNSKKATAAYIPCFHLGSASMYADAPPPPPADADALRCYLARARIADVSIDAGAGAAIEAEFVRARAAGSFAADAETAFHRALTRARLLAKSHAAAALGLDHYRRSNALAGEAVNRAANAPPAGQ
mmetsp:Transcript_24083/g.83228  ORF Transcript_24083/g.83228 Transcript_24083/m.83228 type:complete len:130 (+) Transcript_24083:943-1332(+)